MSRTWGRVPASQGAARRMHIKRHADLRLIKEDLEGLAADYPPSHPAHRLWIPKAKADAKAYRSAHYPIGSRPGERKDTPANARYRPRGRRTDEKASVAIIDKKDILKTAHKAAKPGGTEYHEAKTRFDILKRGGVPQTGVPAPKTRHAISKPRLLSATKTIAKKPIMRRSYK